MLCKEESIQGTESELTDILTPDSLSLSIQPNLVPLICSEC